MKKSVTVIDAKAKSKTKDKEKSKIEVLPNKRLLFHFINDNQFEYILPK